MLRADATKTQGSVQGSRGVGGTGFQIMMRDEAFDVDARWAQALADGDQSLEWITKTARRRSSVCGACTGV